MVKVRLPRHSQRLAWKLLMLTSIVISVAAAGVFTYKGGHAGKDRLIYKLQQTDSSYRYTNGTQGTA